MMFPTKYIINENEVLLNFPELYKELAKKGKLQLIQKILRLNRDHRIISDFVMYGAAKVGNLKILKWMINNGCSRKNQAIMYAAKGNQFETLKWLVKRDFEIYSSATYYAAGNGNLEILNYLIDLGYEVDSFEAACNGRFEIVKHLYMIDTESIHNVCDGATRSGHIDMLKFAFRRGGRTGVENFFCKDIHVLSWLIDNRRIKPTQKRIPEYIAESGNLECLRLFYHHKYRVLTTKVFAKAVISKNIEIIKWLHDLDCHFDDSVTHAITNHPFDDPNNCTSLTILKMLVGWNFSLRHNICSTVAYHGHLETLKYLVSIGCRLTSNVIAHAAYMGHLHVIIWARKQGCKWNAKPCRMTIGHNRLSTLKWLRGIDRDVCELKSDETKICPWDNKFEKKLKQYPRTNIFQFALENGYDFKAQKDIIEGRIMIVYNIMFVIILNIDKQII